MANKSVVFKKQPTPMSEIDKYFIPTSFLNTPSPKVVPGSYVEKRFVGGVNIPDDFYDYKPGGVERFVRGVSDTLDELTTYGSKLEVYGGQGVMALGDFLGSEKTSKVGLEMIQNAQENINYMSETNKYAPETLKDSFIYNLGGGAVNYALMFGVGGAVGFVSRTLGATATVAKAASSAGVFTTMYGLEAGSEAQERIEKYKQETGDVELKNYTPEIAGKNFAATTIYSLGSAAIEKWAFKEQKILFENPSTFLKTAIKAGLTEGGTEALQEALNIGIDFADGTIDYNMLPDRLKGMIMEAAVGATLGFTAGVGSSYYQRSNAIKELKKNLSNVVPAQDLEAVATEIVDKSIETLQGVIATETKLSTEMRTKRGDIYNSLVVAISDAMKDSGAFNTLSEADFAQYASETASIQADVVLAEATKRNVPIDDVIRSSDIRFEDGQIKLGERGINIVSKRVVDRLQDQINELNAQIEQMTNPEEKKIAQQQVYTLAKSRDALLKKLTLSKEDYARLNDLTEGKAKAILDDFDMFLEQEGYTPEKTKEQFVEEKYGKEVADIIKRAEPAIKEEDVFLKEAIDLANENARLDDIYPEYTGETIVVDGKERPVYNSEGNRIAKSKEALINFYKWFGDSKVVDGQGRPLVVYHGTNKEFDSFDKKLLGTTTLAYSARQGFFFTDSEEVASSYGDYAAIYQPINELRKKQEMAERLGDWDTVDELTIKIEELDRKISQTPANKRGRKIYSVYLKAENVLEYDAKDEYFSDIGDEINDVLLKAKKQGKDGVVLKNLKDQPLVFDEKSSNHFVVFEPNQIKSIDNRGTYSLEEDNIYWQFVGEEAASRIPELGGSLEQARQMILSGKTFEEVYRETGWSVAPDGSLRYEISDDEAVFTGKLGKLLNELIELEPKHKKHKKKSSAETVLDSNRFLLLRKRFFANFFDSRLKLKDFLKHDELFRIYPEIADFDVMFTDLPEGVMGSVSGTLIELDPKKFDFSKLKSVIVHETQHAIQKIENHLRGGNTSIFEDKDVPENLRRDFERRDFLSNSLFKELKREQLIDEEDEKFVSHWFILQHIEDLETLSKEYDDIKNNLKEFKQLNEKLKEYDEETPFGKYLRLYGEMESRNAETRMDMPPLLRRMFYPTETLDIDVKKHIPRYGDSLQVGEGALFQEQEGKTPRGAFYQSQKAIELFEKANLSTLPHEFAHFWLDNMWTYANSGVASEQYKQQMQAVWNFLGVKDPTQKLTRTQHEKFATAYERYLWNGDMPSSIIGAVFDDYDRWLQKVYSSAKDFRYKTEKGSRQLKITPEITNWFKSMTTGVIDTTPSVSTPKQILEERKETIKAIDDEAKTVVVEKKLEYNAKPVNVDGTRGYSKVYSRHAQMLGIDSDLSVSYSVADMEKQNELAKEFVSKNPDLAQKVVDGLEPAPEGILKNAIYNAYLDEQMKNGNTGAYLDALRNQSLELTRMGQEIASQRGAVDSLFDPAYWIRHIEENKRIKLATRVSTLSELATGNPVENLNDYLDKRVKEATEQILSATTAEEQQKIAKELAESLAKEMSVDDDVFYQEEIDEPVETETSAYNYIMKTVEDRLGLSISKADAEQIMNKTNAIRNAMQNTIDKSGNPSVLYFKNMSEMEDFANSLSPSPQLAVMTSIFGRGNMLASPKSVLLNIESNLINFITEAGVRRAGNIALGKTAVSAVSKEAKNEYMKYSRDVYKASGYTISTMDELNTRKFVRGEQIISSAGEGLGRKIGQFYEQTVFKYLMGYPDAVFKDFTFVDSVSLQATDIALQEGLSGQELEKRATEIFKDATLVEPKTETGKEIRKQAVEQAMVATYTNEGFISTTVSRLRDVLNKASGNLRIGDLISPFVKTPANVISLGLEYSAGSAIAIKNIKTIVGDFQTGNISEKTIKSLKSLERNAIGFVLAALLAAGMDDDDYIPPYDMLSPSERSLVKQQNGVYNSIKIGNRYVSLDYFGPLAIPMTAILMAKSKRGSVEKITGYAKGVGYQALNIPVIGDFREVLEGYHGNVSRGDSEKILQNITDTVVDFLSARTIPAFVSDIAKASDPYERETYNKAINRVLAKIPVARQTLEPRVSTFTGKTEERAENVVVRALTDVFAGSRVKKQTKGAISTEIQSLYEDDARVSLSDIARSGDLSKLSEETKKKVRREFAQMYAEEVKKLISRESYTRKDSQEKADAINKIRSKIASKLKRKYKEEIRKNKLK